TEAQLWTEGCDQVIHVMDTEADSHRIFEHLHQLRADFVVRLRHDRRVEEGVLSESLTNAPIKLERLVPINKRKSKRMPSYTHQGRPARRAWLRVRATTIEILPPRHMPHAEPLELHVVQVLEEHPPPGEEPIAWVLATSLPVRTKADLERILDIYRTRWLIEEFHKALKTGCMLEQRQLESFEAITSLLAIAYPTACALLHLRSRARQKGLPATDVLRQSLLDCLRAHPKARPLGPNPSAEDALGVVAGLGGHIKNNGPPGWQTIAAGYKELLIFEKGWLAAVAQYL
ncbi:MAG: IS4 family transposase, partial [bacterium]|nr:IS4 family transposase [bacterium]